MNEILTPALALAATGAGLGLVLAIVAKIMHVNVDELTEKIREVLPGVNCGACGYAGCDVYAEKLSSKQEKNTSLCTPGGPSVAAELSSMLGGSGKFVAKSAFVKCSGSKDKTADRYKYEGFETCADCVTFYNGDGECYYSCMGFGDCVKVCKYNAIYVDNGIAVVDKFMCTGCGMCAKACPKQLIAINPTDASVNVACSSHDKGGVVKKICQAGCIGCGLCVKQCEYDAIKVDNYLAAIDPEKCTNCLKCVAVCPVNVINVNTGKVKGF